MKILPLIDIKGNMLSLEVPAMNRGQDGASARASVRPRGRVLEPGL